MSSGGEVNRLRRDDRDEGAAGPRAAEAVNVRRPTKSLSASGAFTQWPSSAPWRSKLAATTWQVRRASARPAPPRANAPIASRPRAGISRQAASHTPARGRSGTPVPPARSTAASRPRRTGRVRGGRTRPSAGRCRTPTRTVGRPSRGPRRGAGPVTPAAGPRGDSVGSSQLIIRRPRPRVREFSHHPHATSPP